jgi:hypothetical protein
MSMTKQEIINEMDGLFKQVVKYYPMKDLAETKKQWNGLVTELKNCNLHIVSNNEVAVCRHCGNKLEKEDIAVGMCYECNMPI